MSLQVFRDRDVVASINGSPILGAESFNLSYSYNRPAVNSLGYGFIGNSFDGQFQGEVSISRNFANGSDPFYPLIKAGNPIEGSIGAGSANYGFKEAYVNSFSANGSVGSVPTSTLSALVLGDIGSNAAPSAGAGGSASPFKVVGPADIVMSINGIQDNNFPQSFEISYNVNWEAVRTIGRGDPFSSAVQFASPITCSLTVEFIVNQYTMPLISTRYCEEKINNLSVSLVNCEGTGPTYACNNAYLISESTSAALGDYIKVNLNYEGYFNDFNNMP